MNKKVFTFLLFIMVAFFDDLKPLLDGRTKPVFVDTNYSFTNGEWALGEVYFGEGFTVTAGQTANLRITVPVVGLINLNTTGTLNITGGWPLVCYKSPSGLGGAFQYGGIINSSDSESIHIECHHDVRLYKQLILRKPGTIDMLGNRLSFDYVGEPLTRGSLNFDASAELSDGIYYGSRFTLKNAMIVSAEDHYKAFAPRFRAAQNTTAGYEHEFVFDNCSISFGKFASIVDAGTTYAMSSSMTMTGCKLAFIGNNQIAYALCNTDKGSFNVFNRMSLTLDSAFDNASLVIGPDVTLTFTSADPYDSASTFYVSDAGTVRLKDSELYFTRELALSGGGLIVDGTSKIKGLCSTAARRKFGQTESVLDILPGAILIVDNTLLTEPF